MAWCALQHSPAKAGGLLTVRIRPWDVRFSAYRQALVASMSSSDGRPYAVVPFDGFV